MKPPTPLLTRVLTSLVAMALALLPAAHTPAAAQTTSTVLNFDSLNTTGGVNATTYLAEFGITLSNVSGGASPVVKIQKASALGTHSGLAAPSPENFLMMSAGTTAFTQTSFTLNLPSAVTTVSFTRPGKGPDNLYPTAKHGAWTVSALDATGQVVASASEPYRFSATDLPAKTFTLTGSGITKLRVDGEGTGPCGCTYPGPFLDDLTFSPALVTGTAGSASVAGSASIAAGTLSLGTVSGVSFSGTLNGQNQIFSSPTNALSVTDATGSGNGWKLTVSGTQFNTGGATPRTLPTTALQIGSAASPVSATAASGSTGVNPTNGVAYPMTVPLGASATAASFFNSAAETGMGKFDLNVPYFLSVPANTFAGSYSGTLTVSLVAGP